MSNYTSSNPKLHNPKSHSPAVYIPCWLIQVPVSLLSHGAKLVYGRLSQWSNEKGQVYRSATQLSKELGMCVSSIEKFQRELRERKLIGTFQPQKGGSNHFIFYDHPWMHEEINKELSYKQEYTDYPQPPPYDDTVPPVCSYGTPPYNHTDINKKEIKTNKKGLNSYGNNEKKQNEKHEQNPRTKKPPAKETFESFWNVYPQKKSKKKSFEIWKRKQLWAIADEIMEKVKLQSQQEKQWMDGYIPYPSTYLNQELWNDEITPSTPLYKQQNKNNNEKKIKQLEQQSIEKSKTEYKNGTFSKIASLALNDSPNKKPPTEQLNSLLKAAGIKRGKKND